MKTWQILLVLFLMLAAAAGIVVYRYIWPPPGIDYPALSEVDKRDDLIQAYLEDERTHALSIGIIQDSQFSYQHYGHISGTGSASPDNGTIYEIGSITKTFTAAVLAGMVREGKVQYDDRIAQYLPEGVVNWPDSLRITLLELATHTSGLPRLPDNMKWDVLLNLRNPYSNYQEEDLFDFLREYQPKPPAKRETAYSNLGYGLLGQLLARVEGVGYETLVSRYVLQPLDMHSTAIELSEDQQSRFAPGYNPRGYANPAWDLPGLAGAGALRSTTPDMLHFLQANMEKHTPFPITHQPRAEMDENMQVGLAWIIETLPASGREIIWHNGGTGGFRSFVGMDKEKQIGVVVLSNTALSVDEIGKGLLTLLSQKNAN